MKKKFNIGLTAGVFDMFHYGHLSLLKNAKKYCHYLIVSVSSDELVKKYKGAKPIVNLKDRMSILQEIKYVDRVVVQKILVDLKQFKTLHADVFIFADDWKGRTDNKGYNQLIKENKVILLPYTKRLSSSKIKEKIIRNALPIMRTITRKKIK